MKKHFYLVLLALYHLTTCYACNKGSIDDNPPPNPIDTTMTTDTISVDTTASDTVVYEDAPIWLPGGKSFAKGLKNGKDFEASAAAIYIRDSTWLGLLVATFSEKGYQRESMQIGNISTTELGEYNLMPPSNTDTVRYIRYATRRDGGDVSGDLYNLDTLYDNKLIITAIDLEQETIKGSFTAALHINEPDDKRDPLNPNYLVFEEVYFECKIVD